MICYLVHVTISSVHCTVWSPCDNSIKCMLFTSCMQHCQVCITQFVHFLHVTLLSVHYATFTSALWCSLLFPPAMDINNFCVHCCLLQDGQIIRGLCGGYCGVCSPDHLTGLQLQLLRWRSGGATAGFQLQPPWRLSGREGGWWTAWSSLSPPPLLPHSNPEDQPLPWSLMLVVNDVSRTRCSEDASCVQIQGLEDTIAVKLSRRTCRWKSDVCPAVFVQTLSLKLGPFIGSIGAHARNSLS